MSFHRVYRVSEMHPRDIFRGIQKMVGKYIVLIENGATFFGAGDGCQTYTAVVDDFGNLVRVSS